MKASRLLVVAMAVLSFAACESSSPKRKDGPKPSESAAKFNTELGVTYMQQGNLALAQEKLERALKQNPRDANVHVSLGMLNERLGETRKADQHYNTALKLAPGSPEITNTYAVFLCKNKRVEEGVKKFDAVAANRLYRAPEVALTNAGVCLRGDKRLDEAEQRFNAAIKARPNYSEACLQLASLHLERGRVADARQVIETYNNSFLPNADVLLFGVTVARAAKDKVLEDRYARKLRTDFPDSEQTRILQRNER
jgi:type IV pilus assembly protein PilF